MSTTIESVGHRFTEGDTGPPLICTYKDETGTPINITGFTITFRLDRPTSGLLTKAATLTDPTNGVFQIGDPWDSTDLVDGFAQKAEIEIVDASAVKLTVPKFQIDVEPRIA